MLHIGVRRSCVGGQVWSCAQPPLASLRAHLHLLTDRPKTDKKQFKTACKGRTIMRRVSGVVLCSTTTGLPEGSPATHGRTQNRQNTTVHAGGGRSCVGGRAWYCARPPLASLRDHRQPRGPAATFVFWMRCCMSPAGRVYGWLATTGASSDFSEP